MLLLLFKKSLPSLFILFFTFNSFSQNVSFKKNIYKWPTEKPDTGTQAELLNSEDLIILNEHIQIDLLNSFSKTLTKNCVLKINTKKGIDKLSTLVLPESFDESADKPFELAGKKVNIPFIYEFKLNYFAIRILKQNGMLQNVVPDITTKKIYWLAPNGNHLEDYCFGFSIPDLETGDVVEYAYE
ncbi:MAG TPA: hypothetical protein VLB84_04645, partial [Bacteroidia bacterium]|nr:hypothetical protein [Bacteroidia bacterium]